MVEGTGRAGIIPDVLEGTRQPAAKRPMDDELFDAVRLVVEIGQASVSMLSVVSDRLYEEGGAAGGHDGAAGSGWWLPRQQT